MPRMTTGSTEEDDLWAAAARRTADAPLSPRRQLLPHDLDLALTHMTAGELQRLAEAVAFEQRRRQNAALRTSPVKSDPAAAVEKRASPADTALESGPKLTTSQINLIRTSIRAGVKPAVLQQQFGISRKQITAILKRDPR